MPTNKIETRVKQKQGLELSVTSGDHTFTIDEPTNQGGTDKGMKPTEALLGTLGTCVAVTAETFAEENNITLNHIETDLIGEIDSDGRFGKDLSKPKGITKITMNFTITSPNTKEELAKYLEHVNNICPVHNTLSADIEYVINIEHIQK